MAEESFFVKLLTPARTEEIKPGLFIQEKQLGGYRQIYPAAWNGKINYKNLIIGPNFWKSFFWFAIILFIAYAYQQDTKECFDLMEQWNNNELVCAKRSSFTSIIAGQPQLVLKDNFTFSFNNSNFTKLKDG